MNTTTRRAHAGEGIELFTERFEGGPTPVVLIMGLGAQMIHWPDGFCEALAQAGHDVVRFDNRDIGLSSRIDAAAPNPLVQSARSMLGLTINAPYSLSDMGLDTLAVLDTYGWKKAAVVGASMGGMIAQRLAFEHPDRLTHLVSIMSSPGPFYPRPHAIAALLKRPGPGRAAYQDHVVRIFRTIGSQSHPVPEQDLREFAARAFDRHPSPDGFKRQFAAILADQHRREGLNRVPIPSLVIHGDEDPLVPLRFGVTTAALLGATLRIIRGMGHDLPPDLWDEIVLSITEHLAK